MDYIQINANTEEGFQDLEFSIQKYWQDEDGNHILRVLGQYETEVVGFEIAFKPNMKPGVVGGKFDNSAFYTDGIRFYSIGNESDQFIKVLAKLYGQKPKAEKMVNFLEFTSFALEGNPQRFKNEYLRFKVFYDDISKLGLYSEMYVNVNIPKGIVEVREKDTEYRSNLYKAFTGQKTNRLIRLYKGIFKKI